MTTKPCLCCLPCKMPIQLRPPSLPTIYILSKINKKYLNFSFLPLENHKHVNLMLSLWHFQVNSSLQHGFLGQMPFGLKWNLHFAKDYAEFFCSSAISPFSLVNNCLYCDDNFQMKDDDMSRVMGKSAFCICENKDADQLRGHREADLAVTAKLISAFVSAT